MQSENSRYPDTELPGTPLGNEPIEAECDNCAADGKKSQPAVTLADGMKLCADCSEELRNIFEEQAEVQPTEVG